MGEHRCPVCEAVFSRRYDRDRHYKNRHINSNCVHQCALCGGIFSTIFHLKKHRKTHQVDSGNFVISEKAFRKKCIIYQKIYKEKMETLDAAFEGDKTEMKKILLYEIETKRSLKASIVFHAEFLKPVDAGGDDNPDSYVLRLRTKTSHLCNKYEIDIFLENARQKADERIDDFVHQGSGWILDEIIQTDIEIGACASLNGACNFLSVNSIKNLKSLPLISLIRNEQQCFFDAVAFHYTQNENRKRLKKFIDKHINLSVSSPVKVLLYNHTLSRP